MSHPKIAHTDHDVLEVIRARWSPRAFDLSRPVSHDAQKQLFEAARWAPSSANEQPWQFIVADRFTSADGFAAMLGALNEGNQSWAQYAPVLVLAAARTDMEKSGRPNQHAWYDTGQAVTLLAIQATSMGLGLRQMAGFDREKARVAGRVEPPFEPVVIMALGYPGAPDALPNEKHREMETQPRARRPISDFVRQLRIDD